MGDFGHFSRVPIKVNISKKPVESLMIKRVGESFFIEVGYENLPSFCTCLSIGHLSNVQVEQGQGSLSDR